MKVYLCGPINQCSDAECKDWREAVKEHFPQSIDPMRRDYRGSERVNYREIVELDKRDVSNAGVILVNYLKPSVGTSMEIFYAWTIGKPVILMCDKDAILSPWLRYHSTVIVHSMQAAIKKIKEIEL